MMVRCDPTDLADIEAYVSEATRHAPANQKLIGHIVGHVAPEKELATAGKGGCLPALVLIPSHAARNLWNQIRPFVFIGR